MKLLGSPRRMPSMTGYGLEVTGFVRRPNDPPPETAPHAGRLTRAPPNWTGSGLRIGIVQARFNAAITVQLATACLAELLALGVQRKRHPPRHRARCAGSAAGAAGAGRNQGHDALIALGCIIRGETYHFELVANESGAGVSRVALDHGLPVANAILTVENEAQAWARAEDKGRDAARVAVEMANLLDRPARERRPRTRPRPRSSCQPQPAGKSRAGGARVNWRCRACTSG
jgi:6,7-dimethyl-8-ribityllumazine synthase